MSGFIKVTVEEGVDLASMDSNGFSDPYVIIELGHNLQRKKTKIVKKFVNLPSISIHHSRHASITHTTKLAGYPFLSRHSPRTLNPRWNETFSFSVTPAGPKTLSLLCWDYDRASTDDFLGSCSVDLQPLLRKRQSAGNSEDPDALAFPMVLPLSPQPGRESAQSYVKGTLKIVVDLSNVEISQISPGGISSNLTASSRFTLNTAALRKTLMIPNEKVKEMKERLKGCMDARDPTLDLASFLLPALPKIVSENFSWVKRLDLSFNRVVGLSEAVIRGASLEELDLNGNNISEIAEVDFEPFAGLRRLTLNGNALERLPGAIGKLVGLERLEVSNNNIRELPKELGRLCNLEELHVTGNPLEGLPASIGAMRNLQLLDASCCHLRRLPDEITLCGRLMDLNLGNNELAEMPEGVGRMGRLITLNLQDNSITDLPLSIGNCENLGQLGYGINIARNPIADPLMLEKYATGPDQLLDYLMKRFALHKHNYAMKDVPMPVDLGEGPPPPWAAREAAKAAEASVSPESQQQINQTAELAQKIIALKIWGSNTIKDLIRSHVAQLRNDTRAASTLAQLLDISYRLKDLNLELVKVKEQAPFDPGQPRQLPPDSPQIEVLRTLVLAALNFVDNGTRAIQTCLASPTCNDISNVLLIVQVINKIKTALTTSPS